MRQREPRQRDRDYLGWIARLPCVACAVEGKAKFGVEVAHCKLAVAAHGWRGWGVQEKSDDRKTTPICAQHHRLGSNAQHGMSERAWWDLLGICPACLVESLNEAYDAKEPGMDVIFEAVRDRRRDGLPTC